MATTVRVADGETLVTDGPFAETKDVFGGYYVIEADDLDARDRAGRAGAGGAHGRLRRDPPGAGVPALNASATSGGASSRSWSASSATSTSPRRPRRRRSLAPPSAGRATARPSNPRAWLVTVAKRRAIDRIRREKVLAAEARRARGARGDGGAEHPRRAAGADLHLLSSGAGARGAGGADAARARRAERPRRSPRRSSSRPRR